jgi:GMP synthase (glutamine-hydrolysing)
MIASLRYLLMQVRNADDPMREQEVAAFSRVLDCDPARIRVHDLLQGGPPKSLLDAADVVLLGGSGHYSAADEGEWLERILDALRDLHAQSKPTFASCWGFQAMARAMGGRVLHDLERAELGTHHLTLSEAGQDDPVFSPLGESFLAQMGHVDRVESLPEDGVLLASTKVVDNQAFRFANKPIYCTQFHPELNVDNIIGRVRAYPEYAMQILGMTPDQFADACRDTPAAAKLVRRFVEVTFG